MKGVTHLDFDVVPFLSYPAIGLPQFPHKKQGRLWLLSQGDAQVVVLATLAYRLFYVISHTIETVCRARTVDGTVGTLVIVIGNPALNPTAGIGE